MFQSLKQKALFIGFAFIPDLVFMDFQLLQMNPIVVAKFLLALVVFYDPHNLPLCNVDMCNVDMCCFAFKQQESHCESTRFIPSSPEIKNKAKGTICVYVILAYPGFVWGFCLCFSHPPLHSPFAVPRSVDCKQKDGCERSPLAAAIDMFSHSKPRCR